LRGIMRLGRAKRSGAGGTKLARHSSMKACVHP
jgi:hypothetical protein